MNSLVYRGGDDELLMILMDAPTRWLVRSGEDTAPASSLRQALCLAHKISSDGNFEGRIVKQPNDEMVVESHQICRLWKQLDLQDR